MTLTRAQIRSKLYNSIPGLGFASTADSVAADGIVDSFRFQDSNQGSGQYEGRNIYVPSLSGDDRVKLAGAISGNDKLLHTSNSYVDQSWTAYEVTGPLSPDELNDCIRRALRRIYFEDWTTLYGFTDGDFSAADASDWTPNDSGTTSSKSATAANNDYGFRALLTTAAGYTRTSEWAVNPGDVIVWGAISRVTASTATATLRLWDATNSVLINTVNDREHSSQAPQRLLRVDTIPAGVYSVRGQLAVSGSGTPVAVWDTLFGPIHTDTRRFALPSWLNEPFKIISFGPGDYGTSRELATGRVNARALRRDGWRRPSDYEIDPLQEAPSARWLQINRPGPLPETDFWIHGLRQYSDIVDLDDETDATNAPEDLILPAAKVELGAFMMVRTRGTGAFEKWQLLHALNLPVLEAQRLARAPSIQPQEPEAPVIPGGRAGSGYGSSW